MTFSEGIEMENWDKIGERNVVAFFAQIISKYFNECLVNDKFSDCLKLANINLVFKNVAVPQK